MLGKLLKHEMKAVTRLLLPIYAVLVVFTIAARIIVNLEFNGVFTMIPAAVLTFYVFSLVAIAVVSTVIIIYRFYKNMVTDEGYLMFTLPVKPSQLINSKLIISAFWTILSVITIVLSIAIVVLTPENLASFREGWQDMLRAMKNDLGIANTSLFFIEILVIMFLSTINGILCIYACIAVGQLFNGHKVLGSFVVYIVYTVIVQVITTILTIAGSNYPIRYSDATAFITKIIFPVVIIFTLILSAIFYLVTNYMFNKKLNLE